MAKSNLLSPLGLCYSVKSPTTWSCRQKTQRELSQSRLGRIPWLTPYTDHVLEQMPRQGIKHVVVACPAFVVDNLETLEEMGMQGEETFLAAGGESFTLIPCVNDDDLWVDGLAAALPSSTPKR